MIAVGTSDGNLSIYDVRQSKKPFRKVQNRKRKLDQIPSAASVAAIKFGVCDGSLWALYRSPKKSVIIEVWVVYRKPKNSILIHRNTENTSYCDNSC